MAGTIRKLDENTANQIAAGEVIERPAAVIKELVENAIDAQATQIDIRFQDGGKTLIEVRDNGLGIHPDELPLAIERHATSKLDADDLLAISSFGFRGEALPSIGAVSRLEIVSKREGFDATGISVEGGKISTPFPTSQNQGTRVRVRDLFYATPARLKFQASDRSENIAILDIIKRLAMSNPAVGFSLTEIQSNKERTILELVPLDQADHARRAASLLGKDALDDTVVLQAEHNGVKLRGFLGLPTAAKGSAQSQYFFVNNRPVRDKLFFGAVKGAYSDLLPSGRYPFIVLFMDIPMRDVDVNVHPAKAEIRFKESAKVRSFILNAIRNRFAEEGLRASENLTQKFTASFQGNYAPSRPSGVQVERALEAQFAGFEEAPRAYAPLPENEEAPTQDFPLGIARAQYHDNYIIAEHSEGLIIVDQHAAHERLIYEKLKQQYEERRLVSQSLLVPEILSVDASVREALLNEREGLAALGLEIEAFGQNEIAVHAVPATLSQASPAKLVNDVIDALEDDPKAALSKRVDEILATMACHGSVRSGRKLRLEEMNVLLREMEATPNSGTCNHGRPTFIKLDLKTLEGRFGR